MSDPKKEKKVEVEKAPKVASEDAKDVESALDLKDQEIQDALSKLEVAEQTAAQLQKQLESGQGDDQIDEDDEDRQLISGPWSKDPKAKIRRVFRVAMFRKGSPYKPNFTTLMSQESVLPSGVRIPSRVVTVEPTPALQYILDKGAINYEEQLVSLRNIEAKGYLVEINPEHETSMWLPARVRAAEKARVEYLKHQAELDLM